MPHEPPIHDFLMFLLAAVVVVPLFRFLRTSPILGYLAAGMIIGPHALGLVAEVESARLLAEFGIVFLLFTIGLELSVERLMAMRRHVFGMGTLQIIISAFFIGVGAWLLGLEPAQAVIVGAALALSSTAFVLRLLEERGERASRFGLASFAILLMQDIAVLPLMLLVSALARTDSGVLADLAWALAQAAAAIVLAVLLGRRVLDPIFRHISATRSSELFVAATLLVVLGTGWLFARLGMSMALGAFVAGLLLSETAYRHQVEADIRPFRGLFLGLFFMTVGMGMDAALLAERFWLVVSLAVAVMVVKAVVIIVLARAFGLSGMTAIRTGLLLAQCGEFGFVLFSQAGYLGLLPDDLLQTLMLTIALTMAATPLLAELGCRLALRVAGAEHPGMARLQQDMEEESGHVVIAGFGRVGQTLARLLGEAGIPWVALDSDNALVLRMRERGLPVYYGDAGLAPVLEAAGLERARALVITLDEPATVRRLVEVLRGKYPDLRIFVRATDMRHLREMETAGVSVIVPETVESSLQLGRMLLTELGLEEDTALTIIDRYRENEYALLDDVSRRAPER